jgi:hypothetical protein
MMPNIGPSTAPKMLTKIVIACGLETNSHGHTSTDRIDVIRPPILKSIFCG